ncbi:MAG: 1-deoxy-D-xylulose-5-phosphate reductoisomerase [Oscillospiraceae bacterium]|nr:1-deoxy-D-xylulose-5-phosphate reductoisomerase [Oscillospiraceae bacterium]MDY3065098.1 1-deoxy-D-xylulose-5-phosphate reductoisomerase [Oscillospiraceae bacterium]
MKKICILGSTGSIGTQTIDVCTALRYPVTGLAAHTNVDLLAAQIHALHPKAACIFEESRYTELKEKTEGTGVRLLTGMEGLCELAAMEESDVVLNAVVGMVGLRPTLSAIAAGKAIALANKETLVTGGKLVISAARKKGVPILPVDSEHSAIFQSMQGNEHNRVKKVILTASGGPFYGKTAKQLADVTVEQALRHPNWSMGAKITVDSATLMNKGLELIEACWLFDQKPEDIEIVVHRESVIHSLVEYEDNAVMAQLGVPDMKLPIQYALTYPKRMPCDTERLSLTDYGSLTFARPDEETFVCLAACKEAMRRGGVYPTIVNGANEQAVAFFLKGKIRFLDIGRLVMDSLKLQYDKEDFDVSDILAADRMARDFVCASV